MTYCVFITVDVCSVNCELSQTATSWHWMTPLFRPKTISNYRLITVLFNSVENILNIWSHNILMKKCISDENIGNTSMHQNLAWLQIRNYILAKKGMLSETKNANWIVFALVQLQKRRWACMAASHWGVWPKLIKSYIFSSCQHDTTMARPHPPPAPAHAALLLAVTPVRSNVSTQGQFSLIHGPDSTTS